jgi:hypothetical protein
MKKKLVIAALVAAAAGSAQAMDVATFLAKGEVLRQRGPLAMFSGEYREIQDAAQAAIHALRQERLAAVAAGRRPAYCPPEHAALAPQEIMAAMQAVPAGQRPRTDIKVALRSAFARKYPCRR